MGNEKQNISLTAEDLKELLKTVVEEVKKPAPPTEKEIADIEQANSLREATAQNVVAEMEAKLTNQRLCSHKHNTGESHCVYIMDGNYVLCQRCQGKIRPEVPKEYQTDKSAIYDTDLFNRVFQEIQVTDM